MHTADMADGPEATPGLPESHAPASLESVGRVQSRRDLRAALLVGILCLLVYNANLRSIGACDTYPARYLPFAIWRYHTVLLDPVSTITAQGWHRTYWMIPGRGGHRISLYPIIVPVLVAPLYLPAVAYLYLRGWDLPDLDRVARIMEKLSASLLASMSAALMYLLLRRRAELRSAILLTVAFAFGTTTWVISSQALWQHGLGELLIIGALFLLTGPLTTGTALSAGFVCGLMAFNRPPDAILAAAFVIYGISWARRFAPLLVGAAALSAGLVLVYNLAVVGNVGGAYWLVGTRRFFQHDLLSGLAGLLISPTRGLFVFSPFLLFLPFGLPQVLRDRGTRGLTAAIGIAAALQVLVYAKADWRQGFSWGPRWLTDLMPVFIWMLPPVVSSLRNAGRIVFVSACGVAVLIQAIGAFWYTGKSESAIFAVSAGPNSMRAAWDVRNTPFIAELRHRRAPFELATEIRGNLDVAPSEGDGRDVATNKKIDFAGWAMADGHSPWEVIVLLDGAPAASTGNFSARPDVTRALRVTSPTGWHIELTPHDLTPGEHFFGILVRANEGGVVYYSTEGRFMTPAKNTGAPDGTPDKIAARDENVLSEALTVSARRAAAILTSRQQAPGYWLTSFTDDTRFQNPRLEMNTFLTSLMVDILTPVAAEARLGESLKRARDHLSGQIEAGGLVRYHGRADAPTIGTLGCAITPDADDTALVWRIAPENPELLPTALATLRGYRTPEGLYRTWLAPRDGYQCINPGRDPNPADVGIQMHILLLLARADPPAARELCRALGRTISEDRIWVYYQTAPLVPILRQSDLQRAGCVLRLPSSRLRTTVPGQEVWSAAGQLLQRIEGTAGPVPTSAEVLELLRKLSENDFSSLRSSPPLLYHNDLTASVRRFYWSEEFGYALWLRLYFENARHHVFPASRKQ
jgi:hypothetical protein